MVIRPVRGHDGKGSRGAHGRDRHDSLVPRVDSARGRPGYEAKGSKHQIIWPTTLISLYVPIIIVREAGISYNASSVASRPIASYGLEHAFF